MRLANKVAIVTGGAGMIGSAIATVFAREGAKVVVADVKMDQGEQLLAKIEGTGGIASFVETDVSSLADTERLAETSVTRYGRLNILVCCAYWQEMGNALELSEEGWHRSLDISLKGVWTSARAAIPHMLKAGGGAIVNLSSVQAVMPYPRRVAYAAIKGGVSTLTRELALDWGPHGIRTNAILPGRIVPRERWEEASHDPSGNLSLRGECYPLNRVGFPEDIANAALFLASDDAAFVNGVNLLVDGGVSIQSAEALIDPSLRRGWRDGRLGHIDENS
jgi:NAD(P)-dependent dehydrogenase (short-subunit alcohol dehydrogenase family)